MTRPPKSHLVRGRADLLSNRERQHAMSVLERLREGRPTRPAADVDAELRAIRGARRAGGRRHRST